MDASSKGKKPAAADAPVVKKAKTVAAPVAKKTKTVEPKVKAVKVAKAAVEPKTVPKIELAKGERPATKVSGVMLQDTYGGKFSMPAVGKKTQAEFLAQLSDRVAANTHRTKAEARTIYHKSFRRVLKTLAQTEGFKFADGPVRLPKGVTI